jgi:hypothetical protein
LTFIYFLIVKKLRSLLHHGRRRQYNLPKKKNTKKDRHNQAWICGPFCSLVHIYLYCTQYCTTKLGVFFLWGLRKAAKASIKKSHQPILYITSNLCPLWLGLNFKCKNKKKLPLRIYNFSSRYVHLFLWNMPIHHHMHR